MGGFWVGCVVGCGGLWGFGLGFCDWLVLWFLSCGKGWGGVVWGGGVGWLLFGFGLWVGGVGGLVCSQGEKE